MVLLVFKTLGNKIKTIDFDENVKLGDIKDIVLQQFELTNCDIIKFIYKGKALKEDTLIKDIGFTEGTFIIPMTRIRKVEEPPKPAPEAPKPAPEPKPVEAEAPKPAPEPKQEEKQIIDNMTDEEFIKFSIENLPGKEKFDENIAELMSTFGVSRDICIRALINTSNSLSLASNLILDNKVPPLRKAKPSSTPAPNSTPHPAPSGQNSSVKAILASQSKKILGMNPETIISSNIVPPVLGKKIPTLSFPLPISPSQLQRINDDMQTKLILHREALQNPSVVATILNSPEVKQVIGTNTKGFMSQIGIYQIANSEAFASEQLPSSEFNAIIPADYTEKDIDAISRITRRGCPERLAIEYYEACNRDENRALMLFMQSME